MRVIVSGTGTGAGKTTFACALARALAENEKTYAIKPFETGVVDVALDACALEDACGQTGLASRSAWIRLREPLAPAAALKFHGAQIDLKRVVDEVRALASDGTNLIVEGAGGLFVPLQERYLFSDFAKTLGYPIVMVVPNQLGVLSHTYAAVELGQRMDLQIACVVLSSNPEWEDFSSASNRQELTELLSVPVFEHARGDVEASLLQHLRATNL